jgi:reverse gyrase
MELKDVFNFDLLIKKLKRIGDEIYQGTKTVYLDINPEYRRDVGETQVLLVFVDGFLDGILNDRGKTPDRLLRFLGMSEEDLADKLMEIVYNYA